MTGRMSTSIIGRSALHRAVRSVGEWPFAGLGTRRLRRAAGHTEANTPDAPFTRSHPCARARTATASRPSARSFTDPDADPGADTRPRGHPPPDARSPRRALVIAGRSQPTLPSLETTLAGRSGQGVEGGTISLELPLYNAPRSVAGFLLHVVVENSAMAEIGAAEFVDLSDRETESSSQRSQAKNIWYNAALRSAIYTATAPLRWVLKPRIRH